MSMDTCKSCGNFVDTDFDTDCYDNPTEVCHCEGCREQGEPIMGWLPIETAPEGRTLKLAAYITPSAEAYRNGSRASWHYGEGRKMWAGHWSGILGGEPSHWMEAA